MIVRFEKNVGLLIRNKIFPNGYLLTLLLARYNRLVNPVVSPVVNRFYEIANGRTYTGFSFSISIDQVEFQVRNYDDLPRTTFVTGPKMAREMPQARRLLDFLASEHRRHFFYFYDEQGDTYRIVELKTLEFAAELEIQRAPARKRIVDTVSAESPGGSIISAAMAGLTRASGKPCGNGHTGSAK